jgi:hypothetical protein
MLLSVTENQSARRSKKGVVLAATLVFGGFLVAISLSPLASGFADKPNRGPGDVELYQAEVDRIAAGEGYYQAASAELHERGYPTRSVFNWRTPLPMWLLGVLPSKFVGRFIIGSLAAVALVVLVFLLRREVGLQTALLGVFLLAGALMPCWLDQIYVMPVVWAGVLIALSIAAYGFERRGLGVCFGLAALFIRELAGIYVVVCLIWAVCERRWREVAAWVAGLALYAAFYAWHFHQAMAHVGAGDRAQGVSWVQFGGAAFLVSIAQMNAFLLLLPQWVTAIYISLAMFGFAFSKTPTLLRAGVTTCAFLLFFAFVGQPINQYWGSLIAPLLCLGACQAPRAIAELLPGRLSPICGAGADTLQSTGR